MTDQVGKEKTFCVQHRVNWNSNAKLVREYVADQELNRAALANLFKVQAKTIRLYKSKEDSTDLEELFEGWNAVFDTSSVSRGACIRMHALPCSTSVSNEDNPHTEREWFEKIFNGSLPITGRIDSTPKTTNWKTIKKGKRLESAEAIVANAKVRLAEFLCKNCPKCGVLTALPKLVAVGLGNGSTNVQKVLTTAQELLNVPADEMCCLRSVKGVKVEENADTHQGLWWGGARILYLVKHRDFVAAGGNHRTVKIGDASRKRKRPQSFSDDNDFENATTSACSAATSTAKNSVSVFDSTSNNTPFTFAKTTSPDQDVYVDMDLDVPSTTLKSATFMPLFSAREKMDSAKADSSQMLEVDKKNENCSVLSPIVVIDDDQTVQGEKPVSERLLFLESEATNLRKELKRLRTRFIKLRKQFLASTEASTNQETS